MTVNDQLLAQQAQQLQLTGLGEPLDSSYSKLRTQVDINQYQSQVGCKSKQEENASKSSHVVNLQSNQTMPNML